MQAMVSDSGSCGSVMVPACSNRNGQALTSLQEFFSIYLNRSTTNESAGRLLPLHRKIHVHVVYVQCICYAQSMDCIDCPAQSMDPQIAQ